MPDPGSGESAPERWFAIARILRPRGRKGEVIAEVLTDFPDRFAGLKRVLIESPGGPPEQVDVADLWWHGERLILRFEGVESIDEAERLRGRLLLVPRQECARLGDHRYYVADLIGCEIVSLPDGRRIGKVTEVEPTGGTDLLHVEPFGVGDFKAGEILIPFARAICPEVDVAARRIMIEPLDGLLDLNEDRPENFEA